MNRLTLAEAEELIDSLDGFYEPDPFGPAEATIMEHDLSFIRDEVDLFLSTIPRKIDPDSIEIVPDRIEGLDLPTVTIRIRTA